ncbi:MAG TPA: PQ-loop domain-containing transporter [Bryobacteraceae bacterium]|nr:PQ-loop domain-containing transporter [Bryobacteraceae bacterium]
MNPLVSGLDGLRMYSEAIGSCAAVLTTAAFTPQLIRTWRTGGAGLSWLMLTMLGVGVWLWFLYGLLRHSVPIVAANGLTGLQILFLAGLKAWHARKVYAEPTKS